VFSITPASALEMGSIENTNVNSSFIDQRENIGNLAAFESVGQYGSTNRYRSHDLPDQKIIYTAVGVTLLVITIAVLIYIYCFYLPTARIITRAQYLSIPTAKNVLLPRVTMMTSPAKNSHELIVAEEALERTVTPQRLDLLRTHLSQRLAPEEIAEELVGIPYNRIITLLRETGDADYIAKIAIETSNEANIFDDLIRLSPELDKDLIEIRNIRYHLNAFNSYGLSPDISVESAARYIANMPELAPVMLAKIAAQNRERAILIELELKRMGKYLPQWKLNMYPPW
jgi:hypothetical protein